MEVKRTERGWAGHYICSDSCKFRRNTLLEYGDRKWVVSTVGGYVYQNKIQSIGYNRWYETMAFQAKEKNGYLEADIKRMVPFESECGIYGENWDEVLETYGNDIDNKANEMHENVVTELMEKIKQ